MILFFLWIYIKTEHFTMHSPDWWAPASVWEWVLRKGCLEAADKGLRVKDGCKLTVLCSSGDSTQLKIVLPCRPRLSLLFCKSYFLRNCISIQSFYPSFHFYYLTNQHFMTEAGRFLSSRPAWSTNQVPGLYRQARGFGFGQINTWSGSTAGLRRPSMGNISPGACADARLRWGGSALHKEAGVWGISGACFQFWG